MAASGDERSGGFQQDSLLGSTLEGEDGKPAPESAYEVIFRSSFYRIAYPVTAGAYVSQVLDREAFRRHCDQVPDASRDPQAPSLNRGQMGGETLRHRVHTRGLPGT